MRRYIIGEKTLENEKKVWRVFDLEMKFNGKPVIVAIDGGVDFEEQDDAQKAADELQAIHDTERFGRLLKTRRAWFPDKERAEEFEREFRRWFRETHKKRLAKTETGVAYELTRGWECFYLPIIKEEPDDETA